MPAKMSWSRDLMLTYQLNLPTSAHPSHPALTRYFLQIQSLPPVQSAHSSLPNSFPPVDINIADLAIPEREVIDLKKEKKAKKPAAAVADGAAEKAGEVAGQAKAATEGVVAQAQSAVAGAAGTVSGAAASAAGAVQGALAGAAAAFSTAAGDVKAAVVGEAEGEAAPVEAAKDGKKKEKKAKPAKAQPVKEAPTGPMPSMIDLRVGKVLDGELLSLACLLPGTELTSLQSRNTPRPTRYMLSRLTWERRNHGLCARGWSST